MKRWGILAWVLAWPAMVFGLEGTLTPVRGSVFVQKADKNLWEELKAPATVREGDRVKTGVDSKAFVSTPDDHRVALGSETEITFQRLAEGETKFFLKNGSIRNKVRKLQTELGQYYKVQTPSAVVAVRGTDFAVLQEKLARVQVYEGVVDLSALKKEVGQALTQISAGQSASVEANGSVETPKTPPTISPAPETPASSDSKSDEKKGPQGPPPGGTPPAPPSGWWESPGKMDQESNLFKPPQEMGTPHEAGPKPPLPPKVDRPALPEFSDKPQNNIGLPPIPPGNSGGQPPQLVGLQALIDTMRSRNLHEQANSILVADLYQRNAVRTDPLTGQLRQYADAVLKVGSDGVRFVNATMIPGVPDTLNYTTAYTKFNAALPSNYWVATRTAFYAPDANSPSWYATDYQSVVSNTVDKLEITASGGTPIFDSGIGRYKTQFTDMSARVNNTTLWTKTSGNIVYLGGSAPSRFQTFTGHADKEVKDVYSTGDFFSVRNTFSDDNGRIVSLSDVPSGMNADSFLDTLNVRTTIRSNLLSKGSLDVFGSAQGRSLAGLLSRGHQGAATGLLNGQLPVEGAPTGLNPS